jgi:hypothetical protein
MASPSPSPSPAPVATHAPQQAYVSLEDVSTPDYDKESGSSNQLNLRVQLPFDGGGQIFRIKIPFVFSAPSSSVGGTGDISLFDLWVRNDARGGQWLEGYTVRTPTGANDSLGSGKYSIGPVLGYENTAHRWAIGFFGQSYFSVIGPSWRAGVGQTKVRPIAQLALAGGWLVGLPNASFTYDWVRNKWTKVPVGALVGKKFQSGRFPMLVSLDGNRNLTDVKGAAGWTIRLLLRTTFP